MAIAKTVDEIEKLLKEPFSIDELEVRVGATTGNKEKGMALAYITNRAIETRLDTVVGMFNWRNEFNPGPNGGVICGIGIRNPETGEWLTKWDGADNSNQDAVKGGLSGAMKRAGTQWGIGRYLYRVDSPWVPIKQYGKSYKIVDELAAKKAIISSQKFEQPSVDELIDGTQKYQRATTQKAPPKQAVKPEAKAQKHENGNQSTGSKKEKATRPFTKDKLIEVMAQAATKEENMAGKATINDILIANKRITGKDGSPMVLSKLFGGKTDGFTQGELQAVHNWLAAGFNDKALKQTIITEGKRLFE